MYGFFTLAKQLVYTINFILLIVWFLSCPPLYFGHRIPLEGKVFFDVEFELMSANKEIDEKVSFSYIEFTITFNSFNVKCKTLRASHGTTWYYFYNARIKSRKTFPRINLNKQTLNTEKHFREHRDVFLARCVCFDAFAFWPCHIL